MNFCFEGGVASFVRHVNKGRNTLSPRPIYIEKTVETTQVEAAIQYNDGFSQVEFSFANTINTIDGGAHLTGFRAALTSVLNELRAQAEVPEGRRREPHAATTCARASSR